MKATIGSYHNFFSTGMIPYNPKRPSKKARMLMKFLGLSSLLPKKRLDS